MIRWLLIIAFIYLIYKLIQGPKRNKNNPRFTYHFNTFNRSGNKSHKAKGNLEEIEEAEFEDITDKEKKSDNS